MNNTLKFVVLAAFAASTGLTLAHADPTVHDDIVNGYFDQLVHAKSPNEIKFVLSQAATMPVADKIAFTSKVQQFAFQEIKNHEFTMAQAIAANRVTVEILWPNDRPLNDFYDTLANIADQYAAGKITNKEAASDSDAAVHLYQIRRQQMTAAASPLPAFKPTDSVAPVAPEFPRVPYPELPKPPVTCDSYVMGYDVVTSCQQ